MYLLDIWLFFLQYHYSNVRGCVKACDQLTTHFTTSSWVRQGFPISYILFYFVMDVMLWHALQVNDCPGVELLPNDRVTDLNYIHYVVYFSDDETKLQRLFDRLTESVSMFGMRCS